MDILHGASTASNKMTAQHEFFINTLQIDI
jgi:hypothetical protein